MDEVLYHFPLSFGVEFYETIVFGELTCGYAGTTEVCYDSIILLEELMIVNVGQHSVWMGFEPALPEYE